MFRTLKTRLTMLFVLAAISLFVVAVAAVTAISLSSFAISENQAIDSVMKRAPAEARIAIARRGSLALAADEIARDLVRPGLRVGIGPEVGPPFVVASLDGDETVVTRMRGNGGPPGREGRPGGRPGGGGPPPFGFNRFGDNTSALPYFLSSFIHIDPRRVPVPGGWVGMFVDPRPLAKTIDTFWLSMLPIGLVLVAAAFVLGRYLSSLALRPLTQTTEALRHFAAGDFTPRPVAASGRDEIGELVIAYNGAVEQVAKAFEERRAAEVQMRQFIGDAGHELRTPLTVIMGFIDVLRRRGTPEPTTTKIYETMQTESRRMRTLIDKLILLARLENVQFAPQPVRVDVSSLAARVVATLQPLHGSSRIALALAPNAFVEAQESEMYEAVQNLVENALKYAPLSPVDVRVTATAERVTVAVEDAGPGLTAEDREHAFDRFYRGSQRVDKEGFGLGLAIVKRAIERAGGTVELRSEPGHGACFTIDVPRAAGESQEPPGEISASA